jgi:S1-C subfamily serine protease
MLGAICGLASIRSLAEPTTQNIQPPPDKYEDIAVATGFFVSDAGHLITAWHAIKNRSKLTVILPGKRRAEAHLLKSDPAKDLALLKVAAITSYLHVSHSDGVPAGMDIISIGYPLISVQGINPKITRGIVNSATGLRDDPYSFQFSAEIQPGNSGGPLIGPGGTVVGIIRSKLDALKLSQLTNDITQNVNYATKSGLLLQFLQGTNALAGTRPLDPEAPMRPTRLYLELKDAIVPILSSG